MGGQTSSTANHYFRPPVPKPQALNAIPNLDLDQRSAERRETRKLNPDANQLKMEIRGARGFRPVPLECAQRPKVRRKHVPLRRFQPRLPSPAAG